MLCGRPALLLIAVLLLAAAAPAVEPIRLGAGDERVPVGARLELLEDPEAALSIEDLAQPEVAGRFTRASGSDPNLGLTESVWWIRLQVVVAEDVVEPFWLELGWPTLDTIDLHVPREGGGYDVQRAGDARGAGEITWPSRTPIFRIPPTGGEPLDLVLRVTTENALVLPFVFWSRFALEAHEARTHLVLGLLHGALALAIFGGLVFLWLLRDRLYLYFVVFVLGYAIWDAANDGLLQTYLWPAWWWSNRVLHVSMVLAIFSLILFVRRFLDTARLAPALDRAVVPLLLLCPVLVVWPFLGAMPAFTVFAAGLAAFGAGWLLTTAGVCVARGSRPARWFLIAFSFIIISSMAYAARGVGLAPTSLWTEHGVQVGIVLTSLTLWLGLAERVLATSRELAALNRELEARIQRRTAELERTTLELAAANRARTEFIATASHDLRQPFHALNLMVGTLRRRIREPDAADFVGAVEESAGDLSEMLDGLLDLSRLDAGMLEPEPGDLALGPWLERLGQELRPQAERKGLELRVVSTTAVARTDPVLLRRIVQNLVTNAIRYTEAGHVELRCEEGADDLAIAVSDTGVGIPVDRRARIFETFTRLDPGDEAREEGLGLGLSIVKRLARLLGHGVELESEEGSGSAFRIRMPRGTAQPAATPSATDPGFDGARVFVVDADPDTREGTRDLVESWGCRVDAFGNGDEARDALARATPPPAALLYAARGGDDGAISALTALRGEAGIGALLISADSGAQLAEAAREAGLILLRKPVAPLRLRAALGHLLAG